MKVLLIGTGGVGEAIAVIAQDKPWLQKMVLADYNLKRVKEVRAKLQDNASRKFPVEQIDARDKKQIVELAQKHQADLIMNAVDPVFNETIFDAAYKAGCHYMDMAMTLSAPHPTEPFRQTGVKLGDYQFERAAKWEKKGLLAIVGMGVEPGMADVFAKYAK
ncbi:MAG: ATP-binding protein, partial [Chloroflexi bacterium]|nr:ATP-binding protein [Chloroflexota bacterium]